MVFANMNNLNNTTTAELLFGRCLDRPTFQEPFKMLLLHVNVFNSLHEARTRFIRFPRRVTVLEHARVYDFGFSTPPDPPPTRELLNPLSSQHSLYD